MQNIFASLTKDVHYENCIYFHAMFILFSMILLRISMLCTSGEIINVEREELLTFLKRHVKYNKRNVTIKNNQL